MEYYVNKYIPVDCVQQIFNKQRIMEIRKYARIYNDYCQGGRQKWIKDTFNVTDMNEIKKGNVTKIIAWAYFVKYDESTKKSLSKQEIEWRDNFIEETVKTMEEELDYKFEEGFNPNIKSIANTVEHRKLITFYHPLTMYLGIFAGKQVSNFIFRFIFGFEYKYNKGLKIWHRMTNNKTSLSQFEPILYFGGVSAANPGQAILLMSKLLRKYGNNKNLFVIEIPWSELSINHFIPYSKKNYINNSLPLSMDEITEIVISTEKMMLRNNNISTCCEGSNTSDIEHIHASHDNPAGSNNTNTSMILSGQQLQCQWTIIAESFGTFITSAVYQRVKGRKMGIIPRMCLVDAPTLVMTDPSAGRLQGTVEKNILKRIFQLAIGQEFMIATLGARYMHWFEYCIYPHELVNDGCAKGHIIVSGTHDHLIPFKAIKNGVEDANKLCKDESKKIEHIIMDGIMHGVWLTHPYYQDRVLELL